MPSNKRVIFLLSLTILFSNSITKPQDRIKENIPDTLQTRLTIKLEKKTFEEALLFLSNKTNLKLNFNRDRIPVNQIISIDMNNARLVDILDNLCIQTGTKIIIASDDQFLIVPLEGEERFGKIYGSVVDIDNQRPLIGANVLIIEAQTGAATNTEGKYFADYIEVGSYTVKISYIGYVSVILTDIIVKSDRITYVNAELEEIPLTMNQVVITDNYFSHLETQPTSSASLSYEEIRRAATIGGDITRVLNGLPGITSENEGNHIVSRGGSTIENGFFVDDIQVPNINHFGFPGTTGGAISLLNIDFIKNINVYTGGFSSQYGDRLSSVLDIKFREGNREEVDAQIDLNFFGITGQVEGPINEGRGSWMASARYGANQFILKLLEEEEQPSTIRDLQLKLVYNLSTRNEISFLNIYSDDNWLTPKRYSISNYWNWFGNFKVRQNILGLTWKYLWSPQGYSSTTLSHIFNENHTQFFATATDEERYNLNMNENFIQFKNLNFYRLNPRNKIEFGVETKLIFSDQNHFYSGGYDFYGNLKDDLHINDKINIVKTGAFFTYEWNPLSWLKLLPGFRADFFDYNNNLFFSPRLALSVKLSDQTTLTGSAGIYSQNLPHYFLVQNENFKKLREPVSAHYIIGINTLLAEDLRLSLEYYYKDYRRLPFDANMPGLYLLDEPISNLFFESHTNLVTGGRAKSEGLEVILQKKMSRNFYGLLSFSVLSARYEDLEGIWRNRAIENNVLAAFEIGYKPDNEWEFNMRWGYAEGRPYTPIDYTASSALGSTVFDVKRINSLRLPGYFNFSIRADKRFYFSNSNLTTYITVWNLFDRKNVSFQGWSEFHYISVNYNLISIIPVLGIEYEF